MQEKVETLQDALDDANETITKISAEIKILQDNDSIKKTAVRYAKWSLIVIPVVCFILLLLSANKGFILYIRSWSFYAAATIELNSYAQSALIVVPIIFFATILGFLLKGVFNQKVEGDAGAVEQIVKYLVNSK